jgi:hypothetical protein
MPSVRIHVDSRSRVDNLARMSGTSLHEIVPVLQVAIGPVILISGVGLLLLTMTNRLGRAIDRARSLARELQTPAGQSREHVLAQVAIIYRRAKVLRLTIALAGISVLLAAVLIITLFFSALMKWDYGMFISVIFIVCMSSLVASLATFIYDIHLSLVALKLELQQVKPDLD